MAWFKKKSQFEPFVLEASAPSTSSGVANDWLEGLRTELPESSRDDSMIVYYDHLVPSSTGSQAPVRTNLYGGAGPPGAPLGEIEVDAEEPHEEAEPETQTPGLTVPLHAARDLALLDGASESLRASAAVTQERVKVIFPWVLGLAVVGTLVIYGGAVVALSGAVAAGTFTAIGGGITEGWAAILLAFYRGEREKYEEYEKDLRLIQRGRVSLWVALHITDPQERDKAISSIVGPLMKKEEG